ncbi:hypothetical protein HYU14_05395 [Candidatus Woesearchaeota archaeon]|nr:hypothetical protein [Candidatus Woesearchaeota archaeon]
MEQTSIQIGKETLERLKSLKEYRRETYDELLNKVIAIIEKLNKDEPELTQSILAEIEQGRKESKEGKGVSTKQLMKKLGLSHGL